MGCSSSTQTHNQGTSKPPAKSVEINGPKKSGSSDSSDQIVDDIETIPDQTKLVPLTEHETSTNGIPPEEGQVEALEAVEVESSEPAAEPCEASGDAETEDADQLSAIQENHDNAITEGETGEVVETKVHEEAAHEGSEAKEEETGHSVDATEPEISMLTAE